MDIRVETHGGYYTVHYNGVRITFELMVDAQSFVLRMMTQLGKIGYQEELI